MEGDRGVSQLDTKVQRLASATSRLHQQLCAFLSGNFASASPHPQDLLVPGQAAQSSEHGLPSNREQSDVAVSSGRENVADVIVENVSDSLGQIITRGPEALGGPAEVLPKCLEMQKKLIVAFALTKGQESSKEFKSMKEELSTETRQVMKRVAAKLHRAEQAMEDVLEQYSMYKRFKVNSGEEKAGVQSRTSVEDIVSYAHKISYSTFAPPSFITNQELPPGFQPPAPQAEHMRASALYQCTEEELGLRPVSRAAPVERKEPEKSIDLPQTAAKPPPGWKPGMPVELPPMPSGWKPGMELPLPPLALASLPPMPPGWKPGDPIPLPTVQPQTAPPKIAERRPQAQPIQVAHVDLDLNPDLEGGFYSSQSEDTDDESESEGE